eukprot:EG_transcript_20286
MACLNTCPPPPDIVEQFLAPPPKEAICVRPLAPADCPAVRELFTAGMNGFTRGFWTDYLRRHPQYILASVAAPAAAYAMTRTSSVWVRYGAVLLSAFAFPAATFMRSVKAQQGYINYSLNDDLRDPVHFYSNAGAGPGSAFWVACRETDGKVVGCIALQAKSPSQAELRPLSVDRAVRGQGLGTRLCKHLLWHAEQNGFNEVVLTTTTPQTAAIEMYTKLGWRLINMATTPCRSFQLKTFSYSVPQGREATS